MDRKKLFRSRLPTDRNSPVFIPPGLIALGGVVYLAQVCLLALTHN